MSEKTAGRVALVTGGSRGIGYAIAEHLAAEGWRVHLVSRTPDSLERALEQLRGRFGAAVSGEALDVRDEAGVKALVDRLEAGAGGIDCLVNNAGVGVFGPVDQLSPEDFRKVVDTNLTGAFYFLAAVAPGMKRRGSGWIFNIASLAAKNPFAGGAAYNASKYGLLGMSEAAMLDLRPHGVRVAAVLPGSVDTGFRPGGSRGETDWMLTPEDVARTVADLLRYPTRALPSLVELRPSNPPQR